MPPQAAPTRETPTSPPSGEEGPAIAPERPAPPDWAAIGEALRGITWREPGTAWCQIVALVGLPKLIVGGAGLALVLTAFLQSGGEHRDSVDGPGAAMNMALWLGAVLALVYVSMAALKRFTSGAVSQRGTLLEVLDSTTLGPNRSVYVVRAGEKRLVLGVTQNQITALAELGPADSTPTPD
jgi:flagellar biosynthetic protein FliO